MKIKCFVRHGSSNSRTFGRLLLAGLLFAGCSAKEQPASTTGPNRVIIKGSNTIGEELGPRLVAEHRKTHPEVTVELEAKGSGSGFWGLIGGVADIAAASRTIKEDERIQAQAAGLKFNDAAIGSYSVALIVNPANPVVNLTREQVRDLFTGVIQNWKEVGGPDAEVRRFTRSPISGTYLGFRELAMEDKSYATNHVSAFTNYEGIVQAVAAEPNGIGYATLQLANKPGVKAVSVGGVLPSFDAVRSGKYPFARTLHFYTNPTAEKPAAREFIQFVQSARGQSILDEMGFVPH
jgi:phosphate transport system substrate-binding protein